VLSRKDLAEAFTAPTPNSRPFNLLQTLCRSCKSQVLWNQANPNSFAKIPGVAYTPLKPASRISNLQTLAPPAVCKSVNDSRSEVLRVSMPPCGIPFWFALCFHNVTNCFSRNLFLFTTIRIARGCHPSRWTVHHSNFRSLGSFRYNPPSSASPGRRDPAALRVQLPSGEAS
jgi:hypothetical protein